MATATLLGKSEESIENVGLNAAMLTLMPPYRAAQDGATVRNGFAGMGALLGTFAASLPRGLTRVGAPLEQIFGDVSGTSLAEAAAGDTPTEVERACFKLYPCARYLHAGIEAARAASASGVTAEGVEEVVVETYELAANLDNGIACPRTALEARFSLPFTVAAALTRGDLLPEDFEEPRLSDPAVGAIARRTRIASSARMTAKTPDELCARVTVRGAGGREVMREGAAVGPDAPLDALVGRLCEKFVRLVAPLLGSAATERAMHDLLDVAQIDDMRAWLGQVMRY